MWVRVAAFMLLVATACYLSWGVWKSALRQRRRERWPRATGTVLEQRMRENGNSVFLEYLVAYEFDGADHQRVCRDWEPGGYTIPYRNAIEFRALMRKRLDAYPEGGRIALLVDPDDPGKVYYRRGWTWPLTAVAVIVSLVFIGFVAMLTPVIFQAP